MLSKVLYQDFGDAINVWNDAEHTKDFAWNHDNDKISLLTAFGFVSLDTRDIWNFTSGNEEFSEKITEFKYEHVVFQVYRYWDFNFATHDDTSYGTNDDLATMTELQ